MVDRLARVARLHPHARARRGRSLPARAGRHTRAHPLADIRTHHGCAGARALRASRHERSRRRSRADPLRPHGCGVRGVGNLLRKGHCGGIMQTLLDASDQTADGSCCSWPACPVRIGNTGNECGGLTAPLVLMGLAPGRGETVDGLPPPTRADQGTRPLQRFAARCGTTQCREILRDARVPLRCSASSARPRPCAPVSRRLERARDPPAARASYAELYAHWGRREFHCADAVLAGSQPPRGGGARRRRHGVHGRHRVHRHDCSALTAGVMASGWRSARSRTAARAWRG